MLCPFCKKEIEDNAEECPYCHTVIKERIARNTNTTNEDLHKVFYTKAKTHQDEKGSSNKILSFYSFFKKSFRSLLPLIIFILAAIIIGEFSGISNDNIEVKKFPPLEDPETVTFNWKYKSLRYTLTETLYKTAYNYYHDLTPKECYCSRDNCVNNLQAKQECYRGFLKEADGDNTISQLALKIQSLGERSNLNDDEIVELTVAFVQSIPYDEERGKKMLSSPDINSTNSHDLRPLKYPYETLFENKGICSDKSILAAALIKQLGYGVSLLGYPTEKHMALGIKCLKDYSSYNSGYCYTEVTNLGYRIGVMPSRTNLSFSDMTIQPYGGQHEIQDQGAELGTPEIYEISDGKSYTKITDTVRMEQERQSLLKTINEEKNQLEYYKTQLDFYQETDDYEDYNMLVPQYNALVRSYNNTVNKYNNLLKNLSL